MAKGFADTDALCRELVAEARKKIFRPVYLLMGDEPFYPDMVCDAVIRNALDDSERDFNQSIYYGADTTADTVITTARRYPMFAERQLVVVKEAQMMKSLEELSVYCSKPLDSTVLVICMHGASADKRKSLYKSVSKIGVVVESDSIRDYEIARWISAYYAGKGLQIAPDAAALLGEYAGTDLSKVAVETDKLLKNGIKTYLEVKAPISGYVTNMNVNLGTYVGEGESVCKIINKSEIMLLLTAYEKDLAHLNIGDNLTFTVNGIKDTTFNAEITSIDQTVNTENRSINVYAKVKETNKLFRPGMYVNAQLNKNM